MSVSTPHGEQVGPAALHVLYIAGDGRSGSTLLARILGQADGAFSAGEVRYLWERGMWENRTCECGRAFADCPFWSRVVDRLRSTIGPAVEDRAAVARGE